MIVDCAVYCAGVRRSENLAVGLAFDALRRVDQLGDTDALVWIELADPTPEELSAVATELEIHPLVIEDMLKPHQRPKLELYPASAFVVLKTVDLPATDRVSFGEISVVLGPQFVVTVRHGSNDPVAVARSFLARRPDFFSKGLSAVLYALADAIVDEYELAGDDVERTVDTIEELVFGAGTPNAAPLIFSQKRSTLTFIRNIAPLEEVIVRLGHGRMPFPVHDDVQPYLRDVLDHLLRVRSRLEQSRDLLTSALEANLAQISIRQNEDMRSISGWAAVIAVPTLFAGVWGMNFAHMPELRPVWGYPFALATIAGSSYGAYRLLKRNGWL